MEEKPREPMCRSVFLGEKPSKEEFQRLWLELLKRQAERQSCAEEMKP